MDPLLLSTSVLVLLVLLGVGRFLTLKPRQEADWAPNEARTAWTERAGDRVTIHNVRHSIYRSDVDLDVRWETRAYDLSTLRRAWYLVVPFQELRGGAHTFVSFEFDDDRFLAISIEARKERGETYGVLRGLLRQFEVIYVVADERDLIGLRTHIRGDEAYLYPVRASVEDVRAFFLDMLDTVDILHRQPVFYNVLTNSCMTRLVGHLDDVRKHPLGWQLGVLLPAFSDRLAYREGLIDTKLTFQEARARYRIDPTAMAPDSPVFSRAIRER